MTSPTPTVALDIGGKKRSLRFTFEALAAIEDETGKLPAEVLARAGLGSPNAITQVLWAGLLHEEPALKVAQVRKWIDLNELEAIGNAIAKASEAAFGKPEKNAGNAPAAA